MGNEFECLKYAETSYSLSYTKKDAGASLGRAVGTGTRFFTNDPFRFIELPHQTF